MDRLASLARIAADDAPWDMAVIGGGATGIGIAVDAASRGYSVCVLEQSDFGIPIATVSDAADTLLQPKLSEIDGVGRVTVQGGMRPAVRVRVDPARLAAYGLAMEDVRTAVAAANVNGAKGGFDGPRLAFALGANDQLVDADAYKNLVIAWRNGAPVRLSAVGSVDRRGGERPRRRALERHAGGGAGHPAPARRQHRADRAG